MGETIQILERRFGCFPALFKFDQDSRVVKIDAVERCWTEMMDRCGKVRYRFKVRCGSARYYLSEDTESGLWTAWSAT
jgi:hypothetical protein